MHDGDDDDDDDVELPRSTAYSSWVATQEIHTFHLSRTSQAALIGAVSKMILAKLDCQQADEKDQNPPVSAPVAPPPPRLWHCARAEDVKRDGSSSGVSGCGMALT